MPQGQGSWVLALAISALAELSLGPFSPFGKHAPNRGSAFLAVAPGGTAPTSGPTTSPGPCSNSGWSEGRCGEVPASLPRRGRRFGPLCGPDKVLRAGPCPQGGQDSSTPGDGEWPLAGHLCSDRCCPLPTPTG